MDFDFEALKSRLNIFDVISRYIPLQRKGTRTVALCPFHDDHNPSLDITSRGWKCFACGEGGDIFRFVSLIEKISMADAFRRLSAAVDNGSRFAPGPVDPDCRKRISNGATNGTPANGKPQVNGRLKPVPASKLVKSYDYTDEYGTVVHRVWRCEPKEFRQCRPGGNDTWIWDMQGVRTVLYRLPAVVRAQKVCLCCGEKDVESLEALGFVATTNPGGEGKWKPYYSDWLAGKTVYFFPDNDEAGRKHQNLIVAQLAEVCRLFVIRVPRGKDVTDWIEDGADAAEIQAAIEAVDHLVVESFAAQRDGEKLFPNDLGMLITKKHTLLKDAKGAIFEYNGKHWAAISMENMRAYANQLDVHMHTSQRRRNEAVDYALQTSFRPEVPWRQIEPWEVPVRNGVVNLETNEVRPHRKDDFLESVVAYRFPGSQKCQKWLDALELYFSLDSEDNRNAKIAALQEFFGYCLMPHARYKKCLFLIGDPDSGKSQVCKALEELVGAKNTCHISPESFDDPRKCAPIVGKALNILTELKTGLVLADGGFKTLISNEESLSIDQKYRDEFSYTPFAKHVIASNNLPRVKDASGGVYNRILMLNFRYTIPREKRNFNFFQELLAEMEGILYWAMCGAARLYHNGGQFTEVPESDRNRDEYIRSQNPVPDFIDEKCYRIEEGDEPEAFYIPTSEFRDKLALWTNQRPMDIRVLNALAKQAGLTNIRMKSGPKRDMRCFSGVRWKG